MSTASREERNETQRSKGQTLRRRICIPAEGVAGWLLAAWRLRVVGRERSARRLQLVEILPLGGKRQLMLVVCDGRQFLAGAGADGVQSLIALDTSCGPSPSACTMEIA